MASKPSSCVVWIYFDEDKLVLGPLLFFGGVAGDPLPDLSLLRVAKHTKGDSLGVKAERPEIRVLNKGDFRRYESIEGLYTVLFEQA